MYRSSVLGGANSVRDHVTSKNSMQVSWRQISKTQRHAFRQNTPVIIGVLYLNVHQIAGKTSQNINGWKM